MKSSEVTIDPRGVGPVDRRRAVLVARPDRRRRLRGSRCRRSSTRRADAARDARRPSPGRSRRGRGAVRSRSSRARSRCPVVVATMSALPTDAGVHRDAVELRGLQRERLHDRAQLRLHRREHTDPNTVTVRPCGPACRKRRAPRRDRQPMTRRYVVSARCTAPSATSRSSCSRSSAEPLLARAASGSRSPARWSAALARADRGLALPAALRPRDRALILAAFFGAGIGLLIGRRGDAGDRPRRARTRIVGDRRCWSRSSASALYVGAETPDSHWFGGGITHGLDAGRRGRAHVRRRTQRHARRLPIMQILDAARREGNVLRGRQGDRRRAADHARALRARAAARQPLVRPRPVALARSALPGARADAAARSSARSACAPRTTARRTAIARRSSRTS